MIVYLPKLEGKGLCRSLSLSVWEVRRAQKKELAYLYLFVMLGTSLNFVGLIDLTEMVKGKSQIKRHIKEDIK